MSKRIDSLHPLIREEVRILVDNINKNVLTSDVKMLVTQGLRTFAEQDKLYAQRPKVTNAKGGQSVHNYGLAFDFCLIKDGKLIWDTLKDFDGDRQADWMEIVAVFKKAGYLWGGDWKTFVDKPHFEKTYGLGWRELLAIYNAGKLKDGYVIIPQK